MTVPRTISVILSTYSQPDWLEKSLLGYACQTDRDFELLVADDGSSPQTQDRIQSVRKTTGLLVRHIWQPHEGFRKSEILNRAVVAATGEYLVFSDGDCIPRRDFIAVHRRMAAPGLFLSGGCTRLPSLLSHRIGRAEIESGIAFEPAWLRAQGLGRHLIHGGGSAPARNLLWPGASDLAG